MEIKYNSNFTMFCEIHEDGNMVDITDKCPIELCKNMNIIFLISRPLTLEKKTVTF